MNPILATREAGHVRRAHNLPHHGEYSVASHSWQMLALLYHLHPGPRPQLIWAVAFHDCAERFLGDLPSPSGKTAPELKSAMQRAEPGVLEAMGVRFILNDEDACWLRFLDQLEFLLWCEDQMALGNRHVANAYESTRVGIRKCWAEVPEPIRDFISTWCWERSLEHVS